jgi:hypothetical protein
MAITCGAVHMAKPKKSEPKPVPKEWGPPGGPFPQALTNEQWANIAELTEIDPDNPELRQLFENVIARYRRAEVNDSRSLSSAATRDLLDTLEEQTSKLRDILASCVENVDAYIALGLARPIDGYSAPDEFDTVKGQTFRSSQPDSDRRLEALVTELNELAGSAALAKRYVNDTKPGPKAHNAYLLVAELDGLREKFTGRKISRSWNESTPRAWVEKICAIADARITEGTIDAAMKVRKAATEAGVPKPKSRSAAKTDGI